MTLEQENCVPITAGTPPLSMADAQALHADIPAWTLKDGAIEREFTLKDFREAMALVNAVADIATAQDHHPDICIAYNKVRLVLATHKIGGLSRNDFILAAKIDRI